MEIVVSLFGCIVWRLNTLPNIKIDVKITRNDLGSLSHKSKKVRDNFAKTMYDAAKSVRQRAEFEAPKFSGDLAEGINIEKRGKFTYAVVSTAPYSRERELGEGLPDLRRVKGDPKFEAWWTTVVNKGNPKGRVPWLATVKRKTPFLTPAFDHVISRLPEELRRAVIEGMEVK